jgi:glyoxylate/hydroxypyruvate reductase A
MTLLLHLADFNERRWADGFAAALPGRKVVTRADSYDPDEIEYIFIWKPKPDAFEGLTRLKAILSLGAGVDALLRNPSRPRDVPIARFMDEDLTQRMSDYVVSQVTMHQRLMTRFKRDQAAKQWRQLYPAPAWNATVGIMGLGALGLDAIRHLKVFGYQLRGWSRSAKQIEGVEVFTGPEQFEAFLAGTDILVNLFATDRGNPGHPQLRHLLEAQARRYRRRGSGGDQRGARRAPEGSRHRPRP